jgi:outer membrane immunogenic protein
VLTFARDALEDADSMPRHSCRNRLTAGLLVLSALLGGGASAHDAPPTPEWSGWYMGVEAGGAWGGTDWRFINENYFNVLGPAILGYRFGLDPQGAAGGVFGGLNYRQGDWVMGVELAVGGAGLDERRASPFFPELDVYRTSIQRLATLSARVGRAWGPWLLYAKAGWAGGEVKLTTREVLTGIAARSSEWANGWMAGFGLDYALGGGLAVGLAYSRIALDMDGNEMSCPTCFTGIGFAMPETKGDAEINMVMLRLSLALGH